MSRRPLGTIFDDPLTRAASIPLVLWVCAAVVAHLLGGGGAMKAAEIVHENDELRAAFRYAREGVHPADTEFQIITELTEPTPQPTEPPAEDGKSDGKSDEPPDPNAPKLDPSALDKAKLDKPKPPDPAKVEQPKPEPAKVAEKPKEPEPAKAAVPVPAAPPPPPPPPDVDHRQAVKQNVAPNQADNPEAKLVADQANHVDHETQARARAQDQDMTNPSMGASTGPKGDPGNSDEDHSGSAEDHKGNEKHAPGENNASSTSDHHENPAPPVPPTKNAGASVPGAKGLGGQPAPAPQPPPSPGGAGPASPEVVGGDRGSYSLDPANPGGDGRSRTGGKKRPWPSYQSPVHVGSLGLGGSGVPGGPQLNLSMPGAQAAVGNEELKAERAADGAARRAAHRGGWEKNKFQRWRPAIENYLPSVTLDNTTALNTAAQPFATYKVTMHNRIHPIFAEEFLAFLDGLPKDSPLNQNLVTVLEIVLNKDTGKVVRMGVTKLSGVTAFDIAALNAVDRAQPFGKAPDLIASPDGNVYFHWEFHRDPVDACTTRNAFPYLLKNPPKLPVKPAPLIPKPAGSSPDDRTPGPLLPLRER